MFTEALERCSDIFAIYNENQKLVFANSAAFDSMPVYFNGLKNGLSAEEASRRQILKNRPDISEEELKTLNHIMSIRRSSGEVFELNITKSGPGLAKNQVLQVRHEHLNNDHTLVVAIDITKIKNQQEEMEKLALENFNLANTDQLTGLANRRHFIETLNHRIRGARHNRETFFLGLADLNGFKRINDLHGHTTGDELLKSVSKRLTKFMSKDTFIARLGGDEFALILPKNLSQIEAMSLGEAFCEVVREPQLISGTKIIATASLGWAAYPRDGKTSSTLMQKSDYALYKSKYSKTQKSVMFSNSDESVMRRQSEILMQLESPEIKKELFLEFQPIHNTQTGTVSGLEALVRWNSPTLGFIGPDEFIPLAEKTRQISKLSKIILRKALKSAANWPKSINLHINMSAVDLAKIDVIRDFISIIKSSNYPPESIIFEVTETAVIDTFENMSEIFDLFKETGLRLSLDDFGKGFSSLSYLTRIPVSCLKVDKSFTDQLEPNSDEEIVLKTIKFMCQNLGIDCIVEGVEHQAQLDLLSSLGLHHMQGFHFSRGLNIEDLSIYLLQNTRLAGNKSYPNLSLVHKNTG